MLPEGYNAIWKKMYETDLLGKVEFLVDDLEIHRDGARDKVDITYSVPSASGAIVKHQEFDFLIYSGNVRTAQKYVKDLTAFEKTLFSEHWTGASLVATTYRAPPIPGFSDESSNFGLMYHADNIAGPEMNGRLYSDNSGHIFADKPDFSDKQIRRALQYYSHDLGDIDRHMPASQEMHATYKAPEGKQRSQALGRYFHNVGQQNSTLGQEVFSSLTESMQEYIPEAKGGMDAADFFDGKYSYAWPYFSRFTAEGIRNGEPWDLSSAQGDPIKMPRTWYVGGAVIFESVNDIISYNMQLLHRHSTWTKPFQDVQAVFHQTATHKLCRQYQDEGSWDGPCLSDPAPSLL